MSFHMNEEVLANHLEETYTQEDIVRIRHDFSRYGFTYLNDVVPQSIKEEMANEVKRVIDLHSERRDLKLATTGNTPRHMSIVRSEPIAESSEYIVSAGTSKVLTDFLAKIAGEAFFPATDDEKYIITKQEKPQDTHGWHWGDFSFALLWIIDTPDIEVGGLLQCVPHTSWDKENPRVNHYLSTNPINTYGFKPGDLYLLRADTTLHRTVPITEECTRIILNLTWGSILQADHNLIGDDRWFEDPEVTAAVAIDD
ncbi:MAG: ArpA protein [Chloroflexota bacterium]